MTRPDRSSHSLLDEAAIIIRHACAPAIGNLIPDVARARVTKHDKSYDTTENEWLQTNGMLQSTQLSFT